MDTQSTFDALIGLLEVTQKRILVKQCKTLEIHARDFAGLVAVAKTGSFKYMHKIYRREIVPQDLQPTLSDLPKLPLKHMTIADKSRLLKTLSQVVKTRRQLVGHMFHDKEILLWHFFYFDQHDTSENHNHWDCGAHIHLVNYLWPNRDPVSILKDFFSERPRLKGGLHIRYIEP